MVVSIPNRGIAFATIYLCNITMGADDTMYDDGIISSTACTIAEQSECMIYMQIL